MSLIRLKNPIITRNKKSAAELFTVFLIFGSVFVLFLFVSCNFSKVSYDPKIAVVMIVTNDTNPEKYHYAIDSVKCYSKIHNYDFVLKVDTEFNCSHTDKFFRRHCAVAQILPSYDALLFLDADIGVVNPNRTIEEFLFEGSDVVFYDRFYNWEVASGSYIVRNTQYAVDFLNDWADYEYKLPPSSFHGTDNGALHIFLAEKLFPDASIDIDICRRVYFISESYSDLFTYEACVRAIFGSGTDFGKVKIMRKGTGWTRDGWLTSTMWNPETDFMFHGWKTVELRATPQIAMKPNRSGPSDWYNPFAGPIDLAKCSPSNSTWSYDHKLMGDKDEIRRSLRTFEQKVAIDRVYSYSRMTSMLERSGKRDEKK